MLLINTDIFFLFSEKLKKALNTKPFIAYRINKNLHQIIGGNSILKSKVVRKNNENHKQAGNVDHASND